MLLSCLIHLFYPKFSLMLECIITRDHKSLTFRIWNAIYLCYSLFISARFALTGLVLRNHWWAYFEWDHLKLEIDPDYVFNWYAQYCWCLAALYAPAAHYLLHVKQDPLVFVFYRFLLGTRKQFFELNPQFAFRPSQSRLNFLLGHLRSELGRILHLVRNCKVAKFNLAHPTETHYQSPQMRTQLVFLMVLIDVYHALAQAFTYLLYFALMLPMTAQIGTKSAYRLVTTVILLADMNGLFYLLATAGRNGVYSTYGIMLTSFVYVRHLRELNRMLVTLSRSSVKVSHCYAMLFTLKLYQFGTKHASALRNMGHINRVYGSPALSAFFLTNIALNVYLITMLCFWTDSLAAHQRALMLTIVFAQIVGIVSGMAPILLITHFLYSSSWCLFLLFAQVEQCTRFNRTKLKFAFYYERVHTNNRATFTVGPLGRVTSKSLFEFLFIYAGYIMYMTRLVKTLQQNGESLTEGVLKYSIRA